MNKVETLAALFGGKAMLALAIDRSPAIVSRMVKAGRIDPKYNKAIRDHLRDTEYTAEELRRALDCLELDTCPTCGQVVPHGSVL